MDVGAWVYRHFDNISGIAFLPYSGHNYKQAPYTEVEQEEYEALLAKMPQKTDWSALRDYETEDNTAGPKSYACTGEKGTCEIVDLIN
jgi:ribonucleoside-diphosphate reductase alpha chain